MAKGLTLDRVKERIRRRSARLKQKTKQSCALIDAIRKRKLVPLKNSYCLTQRINRDRVRRPIGLRV
jgi:hypothetical protein